MQVYESSPVESQERYDRVTEVNKPQDSEKKDNTDRSDDQDRVTISKKAREMSRQDSEMRAYRDENDSKVNRSRDDYEDSMKVAKKVLDEM